MAGVILLAVCVLLFAVRLIGPPTLADNDQERPASYALDALRNGHWICQVDWMGKLASKPPVYTWLVALCTLPFGRLSHFTLYLPLALAVTGAAFLLFRAGSVRFSWRAGFFGALVFVLSPMMMKLIALARTDALFCVFVAVGAFLALRAWETGRGWTWFWLAAAAATLTKGPLGVVLAAGGLFAVLWERKSGSPLPLRGRAWPGFILFLVLVVGWFYLAYTEFGTALVDKMIGKELVGHAVRNHRGGLPGSRLYLSPGYFLLRFAPWSLVACAAFWRVVRRPAADERERRFERFLFCWFFTGLTIFSIAPHQRGDLLAPLIPAAALLAGRELDRWLRRLSDSQTLAVGAALAGLVLLSLSVTLELHRGDKLLHRTAGMGMLAGQIEARLGEDADILHVDTPFTLQFYLNTMKPIITSEMAVAKLKGKDRVVVAACDWSRIRKHLRKSDVRLYEVARWPATGVPLLSVLSNRPLKDGQSPVEW